MSIIQTNIFKCDRCKYELSEKREVFPYDDPVVAPPGKEWEFIRDPNNESENSPEFYLCPECVRVVTNHPKLF